VYPGEPSATISVFRKPAYSGGAVPYSIKVDGVECAKIMPNDQIRLAISAGQHRIQMTMWSMQGSEALYFQAQPGEEIAFSCQGTMRNLLHPINLERVPYPQGPSRGGQPADRRPAQAPPNSQYPGTWTAPAGGPGPGQYQYPQPQHQQRQPPPHYRAPEPQIVGVQETGQFEEPLGEEVRVIDNQHSGTGVTRSVKASREWSRTLTLGNEHTRTLGAEVSGGVSWLKAKGNIESELQRTYSMETNSRHLFEEEITISVPERTSVRLVLRWKRIWQRGVVRMDLGDGSITEVPYQVVVNVTFDQSQEDVDTSL
jgi:hypothetical protein